MHGYRNLLARRAPMTLVAILIAGGTALTAANTTAAAALASQDGSIKGRVLHTSGRAIAGAAVTFKPGNRSAVTDRDGFFSVRELPPGNYTAEVDYEGLQKFSQSIVVEIGKTAVLNVKLQELPGMIVEVTDSRVSGEAEALNKEKNSMDIVTILPAEVIKSLPNANVADAIGRLPSVSLERDEGEGKYVQVRGLEPRFTSVSVNGVRIPSTESGVRQIKLDGYPSDLLGTIELHKTVSADLEGGRHRRQRELGDQARARRRHEFSGLRRRLQLPVRGPSQPAAGRDLRPAVQRQRPGPGDRGDL